MLALCDCNNFFVSCERLYRPELRCRPVVVLSSNDGCVVSRSDEVKAMGIPMGQPYFQIQGLLRKKGVVVCSGSLVMYKEISEKVMRLLSRFTGEMEEYSIDEAFFSLPAAAKDPLEYVSGIRATIERWIGIPVSIGVAATKTLSKLATDMAKKDASGVRQITGGNARDMLDATEVRDIWGIGRKTAEQLNRHGIFNAGHFVDRDPVWVKKRFTVRGLMTQLELKGQPCMPIAAETAAPKSIQVSRTWGNVLESLGDVSLAMIDNVVKAARQLRQNHLAAGGVSVFLRYGYRHHGECGYITTDIYFDSPAQSDSELIGAVKSSIDKIYRPGLGYTQGGVTLRDFSDARFRQRELFSEDASERRSKLERFSRAADEINGYFGRRAIFPASLAVKDKKWRPNRKRLPENI
ncbi:MAG: Y-family DNA polymerase [Synergistaceae bacterium]|jgi:DNA polymerase V|nr:Y-family DNA polymerase [Synergistaceae bacterium]